MKISSWCTFADGPSWARVIPTLQAKAYPAPPALAAPLVDQQAQPAGGVAAHSNIDTGRSE